MLSQDCTSVSVVSLVQLARLVIRSLWMANQRALVNICCQCELFVAAVIQHRAFDELIGSVSDEELPG